MSRIASGDSAFATFVQSAPRLLTLLRQMRPTWELPALSALDADFVRRERIRGLVWDVDGTLTGDRRPALVPEVEAPFKALLAAPDVRHAILSNAGEARFRELGEMFPDIPILRAYARAGTIHHRKLHRGADSWTAEDLAARLSAGLRVIRKPSAALIDYAVRELGGDRESIVMVGDQYLTDVAGANLGGVRSVKLPTLAPESFRVTVRVSQRVEALMYRVFHRSGSRATAPP
jgi:HAD superfamily phosphatase (TIGR01668 family)